MDWRLHPMTWIVALCVVCVLALGKGMGWW
jgi:hypothetical protein